MIFFVGFKLLVGSSAPGHSPLFPTSSLGTSTGILYPIVRQKQSKKCKTQISSVDRIVHATFC